MSARRQQFVYTAPNNQAEQSFGINVLPELLCNNTKLAFNHYGTPLRRLLVRNIVDEAYQPLGFKSHRTQVPCRLSPRRKMSRHHIGPRTN